jgi:hypothetical protein
MSLLSCLWIQSSGRIQKVSLLSGGAREFTCRLSVPTSASFIEQYQQLHHLHALSFYHLCENLGQSHACYCMQND